MSEFTDLFEPQSVEQSRLKWFLRGVLYLLFRGLIRPPVPVWLQRCIIRLLTLLPLPPRGVRRDQQVINGVPCEWQRFGSDRTKVLLYLHGGGFVMGSPATHRGITAGLAKRTGMAVCVPDYRLAPEHPFPAGPDDCVAVYRGLLGMGFKPNQICIAGDSAGGNLTLLTTLRARDMGLSLPAAMVCFSPVTDLSNDVRHQPVNGDPLLNPAWMHMAMHAYCPPPLDLHMPSVSPLNADLAGLPPLLLQVGEDEVLRDDSLRFAERARAASVDVRLERYAGMWHVFQAHVGVLKVANLAMDRVAAFLKSKVS